jgi:hypothetical protein
MALSSDEIVKREIIDTVGAKVGPYYARVFSEGSNDDQRLFNNGGLTFSFDGQDYGSCDCVYVTQKDGAEIPVLAIEGTDCLSRGSSGNAQYQRFHHALGAIKQGVIGIYYLRKGEFKVQPDLYGMAYNISKAYNTPYLIVQDLGVIRNILELMSGPQESLNSYIENYQKHSYQIYLDNFSRLYQNNIEKFADKRSTIIFEDYVVKYSSRNSRNFTDGQLRGGHIAVGEMFLTKSIFVDKKFLYLWPRMTKDELLLLDTSKSNDKEWRLLRHEPGVEVKTLDDLVGLPEDLRIFFLQYRADALKGALKVRWNEASKQLHGLIKKGQVSINF